MSPPVQDKNDQSPSQEDAATMPEVDRSIPATSFPLFPKLPLELRTIVWKHAAIIPRTEPVVVHFHPKMIDGQEGEFGEKLGTSCEMSLRSRQLGVLGANHESRKFALEENPNHLQVFGTDGKYRSRAIYFNPERNIIHFKADKKFWDYTSDGFGLTNVMWLRSIRGISNIRTFTIPAMSAALRKIIFGVGDYYSACFGGYLQVWGEDISKSDSNLWVRRECDVVGSAPLSDMPTPMRPYFVLDNKIDRRTVEGFRLRKRKFLNTSVCDPNNEDTVLYWTKDYISIRPS